MVHIAGYEGAEAVAESTAFTVWRAHRRGDGETVALKAVRASDPEGRLGAQLEHELAITQSLPDGAVARGVGLAHDGGRPVLVRLWRGHETLAQRLARGALTEAAFYPMARAVVAALGVVHRAGVLHRDIKPSNLLLSEDGAEAWVSDFGIALRLHGEQGVAARDRVEGTLAYIAPEQSGRTQRTLSPASDLYALGVVFYEALAGQLPLRAESTLGWLHAHLAQEPAALASVAPAVSPSLCGVIHRLLEKDPAQRYQSAAGLAADLARCAAQFARGETATFALGCDDVPERFRRPEQLVGRAGALSVLREALGRARAGRGETVRLRGETGAGKSSLVRALQREVAALGGMLVEGKQDPLQGAVPYAGIASALRQAVGSLLGLDAEGFALWRYQLREALKPNARCLVEVVPELGTLLGETEPLPALGPAESDVRFQLTFRALVSALSTAERPLVLFLDDLQWADEASLKLIESVAARRLPHLLLVTAERDPWPDPEGRLGGFWQRLSGVDGTVDEVHLDALDLDDVAALVGRVFPADEAQVAALAGVVRARTGGNPYATVEFLGALSDAGVIHFDPQRRRWAWSLDAVKSAGVPDTVSGLVAARLAALDPAVRRTLTLASAVGNQFGLAMLAALTGHDHAQLEAQLGEALGLGLVVPSNTDQPWRFAHDRVREAAHQLLPETGLPALHAQIAETLVALYGDALPGPELFALAYHLSRGEAAIAEPDTRTAMASRVWQAARLARAATAYRAALGHLDLVSTLWGSRAVALESRLDRLIERAECAYLATDFEAVEASVREALSVAPDTLSRARIAEVRVRAANHRGRHVDAIALSLEALAMLGLSFPAEPGQGHVLRALAATRVSLGFRSMDALAELPELRDASLKIAFKIIGSAAASAFFASPNLFPLLACRVVQLTVAHGATGLSAFGYIAYGLIVTAHFGQVETGLRFGDLARRTIDRFADEPLRPQIEFILQYFIRHWTAPLADCVADHQIAARRALETGNLEYWAYNLSGADLVDLFRGVSLAELGPRFDKSFDTLSDLRQTKTSELIGLGRLTLRSLQGEATLEATEAADEAVVARYRGAGDLNGVTNANVVRIMRRALFAMGPEACESYDEVEANAALIAGQVYLPAVRFYGLLAMFDTLSTWPLARRARAHVQLRQRVSGYRAWGARNAQSYGLRATLLDAELARVEGRTNDALSHFERAVAASRQGATPGDEAIVLTRAARWHRSMGRQGLAISLAREARGALQRYGAGALVRRLDAEFALGPEDPAAVSASAGATTTTNTRVEALDLESALKAARALSGEIVLDQLLNRVLDVVIENAGARRGALLRLRDGALWVEAESHVGGRFVRETRDLDTVSNLPSSVLRYVARTGETVLLSDAATHGAYVGDAYVRAQGVRSVLCTALSNQGTVTGVLYLEHDSVPGAFPPARVELVRVLAAQAAVSLENARLYDELRDALGRQIALTDANRRFVPAEFIRSLGHKSIDEVALGDSVQKTMTVLFSDMRGFTRHVEGMTPEENIAFINDYLAAMEPAILDQGGFVDSYIGDAIMALFDGAPEAAVVAGVGMLARLGALNARRAAEGRRPIAIGVGLNTGELTLGTIGGPQRIKCGVIGDCVNLGARIESLTKHYNVALLIGDQTAAALPPGRFLLREVDRVRVVGRMAPVTLYEVFDADPEALRAAKADTLAAWHEALALHGAGRFTEALAAFDALAPRLADDPVFALRRARTARYLDAPPSPFTGVEELEHK